jgi:prephenate dehydrogenase
VPFVLTPFRPDRVAVERARSLVELLGAVPLVMDAATHDRLVARTSHLPHLVANALASMAARPGQDLVLTRALAGPGYRSSTRLAASDCRMVADFVSANRDQVDAALQEFRRELDRLAAALASGPATLEEELSWGRVARALVLGPA